MSNIVTLDSLEIMIDDLKCNFENLHDNEPNDEEYAEVVKSLLELRQIADQLVF